MMATETSRRSLTGLLVALVILLSSGTMAAAAAADQLTAEKATISGGGAMAGGVSAQNVARGPLTSEPPLPFGPPVVGLGFDGFGFDDNAI